MSKIKKTTSRRNFNRRVLAKKLEQSEKIKVGGTILDALRKREYTTINIGLTKD